MSIRLNKFLADAGKGSRRQCEQLILRGRVSVNNNIVTDLATKVEETDTVLVDKKPIARQKNVYWLVNKPKGYLCTNFDPGGRPIVIDLLDHVPERVYTVGRLDAESTGLILLTNDGDLGLKLTHPRYGIEKTYRVLVAGVMNDEAVDKLTKGIWLSVGKAHAKRVKKIGSQGQASLLEIVLAEGKNREIRRMLAKLGHKVMSLRRVSIGPIKGEKLRLGKARKLSLQELTLLRKITQKHQPGNADQQ